MYRVKPKKRNNQHYRAVLGISVGQPYHESEKFLATILWLNDNFKECHIIIADTLQRHNSLIAGKVSEKACRDLALQAGTEWLGRNNLALERFQIPYTLSRWDEWLDKSSFGPALKRVESLYRESPSLYKDVQLDVRRYIENTHDNWKWELVGKDFLYKQCVLYVLEEIAVYSLVSREIPGEVVYPGEELLSMRHYRESRQEGLTFTRINLRRRAAA